jgi:hypothetical protein
MNPDQPQDPILIIEGLRQQIYMLGANDSENSRINVIVEMYKKGEILGGRSNRKGDCNIK